MNTWLLHPNALLKVFSDTYIKQVYSSHMYSGFIIYHIIPNKPIDAD